MALYTTLASLSQTAASNAADGAVDAPSTIDQQTNLLASFIAQLRDGAFGAGQCRLIKSGANLLLIPVNGNRLTINGAGCVIPSSGVALAPTGATPLTLYYIYAYMAGSVMTLEYSTTSHATDVTTGVEIKAGDATRTLVGMARPIAGPNWVDTITQRLVVSWFNQRPIYLQASLGSSVGKVSTGAYGILDASLLLEFISWSAVAQSRFQGRVSNNVVNAVSSTATFLDATNSDSYCASGAYAVGAVQPVYCSLDAIVPEGFHNFNVYVQQDVVSTSTYTGGIAGLRCVHSAVIQG